MFYGVTRKSITSRNLRATIIATVPPCQFNHHSATTLTHHQ
jgi:hypothetical protein